MQRIFISHATDDKPFVDKFVEEILTSGFGVKPDGYFYSSDDFSGIKTGEDFIERMRSEMKDSAVVIALITPRYLERPFCLMELGAVWVLTKNVLPILVDEVSFSIVSATLGPVQGLKISDTDKFPELREALAKHIDLLNVPEGRRSKAYQNWKRRVSRYQSKFLGPARSVSADQHEELQQAFATLTDEHEALEEDLEKVEALLKELEAADSAEERDNIRAEHADASLSEQIDKLISEVKQNVPGGMHEAICLHVCMRRFCRETTVEPEDYKGAFDAAIADQYIDDDLDPNWNQRRMKMWLPRLIALAKFLNDPENSEALEELSDSEDTSYEIGEREFWIKTVGWRGG